MPTVAGLDTFTVGVTDAFASRASARTRCRSLPGVAIAPTALPGRPRRGLPYIATLSRRPARPRRSRGRSARARCRTASRSNPPPAQIDGHADHTRARARSRCRSPTRTAAARAARTRSRCSRRPVAATLRGRRRRALPVHGAHARRRCRSCSAHRHGHRAPDARHVPARRHAARARDAGRAGVEPARGLVVRGLPRARARRDQRGRRRVDGRPEPFPPDRAAPRTAARCSPRTWSRAGCRRRGHDRRGMRVKLLGCAGDTLPVLPGAASPRSPSIAPGTAASPTWPRPRSSPATARAPPRASRSRGRAARAAREPLPRAVGELSDLRRRGGARLLARARRPRGRWSPAASRRRTWITPARAASGTTSRW